MIETDRLRQWAAAPPTPAPISLNHGITGRFRLWVSHERDVTEAMTSGIAESGTAEILDPCIWPYPPTPGQQRRAAQDLLDLWPEVAPNMRVRVLSRVEVETGGAEGADAVISIRASTGGIEPDLAMALAQATRGESARLLRLSFDDIGIASCGHFVGPSMVQITDAIEFGRRVIDGSTFFDGRSAEPPLIAIHCEHGKSRSAAVALALLADHLGDGREHDAVNTLLRDDIENMMHPNPLVIGLIDDCLFRYGRINAALAELSPRYAKWRELWRNIATDPNACWEKARRVLSKRGRD
jgi:predicted protein tyrosine phosphatase